MNAALFMASAWAGLVALATKPAAPAPIRVGVLNTGELVLVDASDRAQVLSAGTTARVRDALFNSDVVHHEMNVFLDREAANGNR